MSRNTKGYVTYMTTLKEIKTVAKSLNHIIQSNDRVNAESEIVITLNSLGFYFIGDGINRKVYGNGEYVIKIDFCGGCDNQNEKEVKNYFSLSEEERKLFPEIIDYDKNKDCYWILAEEVKVLDTNPDNESYSFWSKVADELEKELRELHLYVPDLHRHNVGLTKSDGRMVVVDMGIGDIHGKH